MKSISLTVQRNNSYEDRECQVTIQSKDKIETISVKQDQLDGIIIEPYSVYLSDAAQVFEVPINYNVDFDVSLSCDWLQFVSTKALMNSILVFHAEENTLGESRSSAISLKSKNGNTSSYLYVEQKQRDYIQPSSEYLFFGWEASSEDVLVESNVDFEIGLPDDCEWIRVNKTGGDRNYILEVSVEEYVPIPTSMADLAISDRSCVISLVFGDSSKEITVSQSFRDYIWVSQKSVSLYIGESFSSTAVAYLHSGINNELTWTSSDEAVATVINGTIYAKTKGTADIKVQNADNSYHATIPVTVKKATDDIQVTAVGLTISSSEVVFQSRLYWPSQIKNISFLSVWLCFPDGTAYDIQGTRNGYVRFKPIYYGGSWDAYTRAYYSTWFVLYQIIVDGEYLQYSTRLDPSVFMGSLEYR